MNHFDRRRVVKSISFGRRTLAFIVAALAVAAPLPAVSAADKAAGALVPAEGGRPVAADTIAVHVVSSAICVNTPPTIALIEATAREMGLRVDITRQIAVTQEEANQYRFFGSPTVQLDGLDLEPGIRKSTRYVLS